MKYQSYEEACTAFNACMAKGDFEGADEALLERKYYFDKVVAPTFEARRDAFINAERERRDNEHRRESDAKFYANAEVFE